jgi:hypothetical protein
MGFAKHGRIKIFQRPKVVIDSRGICPGTGANLLPCCAIHAFFGKNLSGNFKQADARGLLVVLD